MKLKIKSKYIIAFLAMVIVFIPVSISADTIINKIDVGQGELAGEFSVKAEKDVPQYKVEVGGKEQSVLTHNISFDLSEGLTYKIRITPKSKQDNFLNGTIVQIDSFDSEIFDNKLATLPDSYFNINSDNISISYVFPKSNEREREYPLRYEIKAFNNKGKEVGHTTYDFNIMPRTYVRNMYIVTILLCLALAGVIITLFYKKNRVKSCIKFVVPILLIAVFSLAKVEGLGTSIVEEREDLSKVSKNDFIITAPVENISSLKKSDLVVIRTSSVDNSESSVLEEVIENNKDGKIKIKSGEGMTDEVKSTRVEKKVIAKIPKVGVLINFISDIGRK